MPFRGIGQGKRCKICAHCDQLRLQATTQESKQNVMDLKNKHIQHVKGDRTINVRGNQLSEHHASDLGTTDGSQQLLKITIDGRDQAKFRIPRNMVPQQV